MVQKREIKAINKLCVREILGLSLVCGAYFFEFRGWKQGRYACALPFSRVPKMTTLKTVWGGGGLGLIGSRLLDGINMVIEFCINRISSSGGDTTTCEHGEGRGTKKIAKP